MSEILDHIDFSERARFQFYDAFFRPYHFDTYGPKTNFFTFSYEITRRAVQAIW